MRRREFIAGIGGATLGWPLAASAQPALPVIGFLSARTFAGMGPVLAEVYKGLADQGLVENRNFIAQLRWADDTNDRMPALVDDLVRRRVNLIVVMGSTPGALAAKAATQTIPIVFLVGTDPVEAGLVPSLARPGGNLTGVTIIAVELTAKNLSLMHELVPAATSIAVLLNPDNRTQAEAELREAQAAARTLGVRLLFLNASTPAEIDTAFVTLARERAGGLVVTGEAFFAQQDAQLVALAARYAVPTIYPFPQTVVAGGLMSYGTNLPDLQRQLGVYAGRVLKGEKPADLPVQRATRVDLALNLKTAKALGLTVPTSILLRAVEVIE